MCAALNFYLVLVNLTLLSHIMQVDASLRFQSMSTEIRPIGNLIYNKGTSTNSELDIIIKCQEPKTNEVSNKGKDS